MATYASNPIGLTLDWSGYAEQDGRIIDSNLGRTTVIPGSILKSASPTQFYVGYGTDGFYDGNHLLLYSVNSTSYNFITFTPGVTYTSNNPYEGKGGLGKQYAYTGLDKSFVSDLQGNGTIEGWANFNVSSAVVKEGDVALISISRSKSVNSYNDLSFSAQFEVETLDLSAKATIDYTPVKQLITFSPGEEFKQIQIKTIQNSKTDGTRQLKLNVNSSTGDVFVQKFIFGDNAGQVLILDDDIASTYLLTPSSTTINEGSGLTTNVSTTNVASGTTLYYSLSGTGVTTTDFSSGSLTGSGTVSSSGSFSFSHTLANDLTTEGTETLEIKLYSDSSRTSQVASTSVSISDTSKTQTYSLSASATSINEGSSLTTSVSTTNVASGTTLYYSLSGTGVTTTDFSSGSLTGSGTVSSSGSFSLSHTLANDLTTEGSETLQIRLFTDSDRSNQVATTSVSISDTSITPPTLPSYLLTPSATTINEGSLVSTTITTTKVASGTTLYWSAVGSGITTSDFSFGALSGSASIGSDGKATFSHVLANDLSTEGTETLNILLYSDSNRTNQVATTSIAINDTSIAPATPTVAVGGNNTGVINTGTINNSGTINSGTINTNSGNTTNTTTNTSNVTVGPTIINNITNTTTNTTSVLSNTSYPTYNVNNTWANNLVTGAITGSAPTLAKNSFDYKFYNLGGGRYGVQEKGSSKIDEITGASSLKFADQTLTPANDVAATFNQVKGKDDVSGVVFRLYNAAFSRLPDANGLQNWINGNASGGMTYASSAQSFSESQEFKNRYGSNVTDTQFITTLYNNVLGRSPDAGGLSHYQSLLAGGRSRGALLLDFSESPENRVLFTQVTGLA